MWNEEALYSWREQERRASKRRRIEVCAIVASYLLAVGGATTLFILLSRAPV